MKQKSIPTQAQVAAPTAEYLPAVIAPPSLLTVQKSPADDVGDAFAAELTTPRNEVPGIPIIRIDHAAHAFSRSGNLEQTIRGYMVHWFQARAWWKHGYTSGSSNPPDCFSADMIAPSPASPDVQAVTCEKCPLSKFGSAPVGKGQACKVNTFLFLVNPLFGTPPIACLILPPSSIRAVLGTGRTPGYMQTAKAFRDPSTKRLAKYFELVWTEFGLVPGGDRHDVLAPRPLAVCPSADEGRALGLLRNQFMAAAERLRGDVATVATGEEDA